MAEGIASFINKYTLDSNNVIIQKATGTYTVTESTSSLPDTSVTVGNAVTVDTLTGTTTLEGYKGETDVLVSDDNAGTITKYLLSDANYTVDDPSASPDPIVGDDVDNLGLTMSGDYTYCFLAGTNINTPTGLIPVEQLVIGNEVLTADGKTVKIRFNFKQIKTSHAFAGTKHYPIKISAGALADNIPSADLFVTPDHAIYFPALNIFAEASTLINGVSIYQLTEMPASFTYYHLLCENQEIVLAENTPAETFIDNVTMAQFDNYEEYVALYPNHNEMIELDIPRAKSSRQLPRELKEDLLQRAELLYPSMKSKAA